MDKSDFFVYSFFVQLNICIVACLENSYTFHNIFALHGCHIFSYFNTSVKNSFLSLKFKLRNQLKRADTVWQVENYEQRSGKKEMTFSKKLFLKCVNVLKKENRSVFFSLNDVHLFILCNLCIYL